MYSQCFVIYESIFLHIISFCCSPSKIRKVRLSETPTHHVTSRIYAPIECLKMFQILIGSRRVRLIVDRLSYSGRSIQTGTWRTNTLVGDFAHTNNSSCNFSPSSVSFCPLNCMFAIQVSFFSVTFIWRIYHVLLTFAWCVTNQPCMCMLLVSVYYIVFVCY